MNEQEALQRLYAIISDVFMVDRASLRPGTSAVDVPGWDSVSQVALVLQIEDQLGVQMQAEELNDLPNIQAIARSIVVRDSRR